MKRQDLRGRIAPIVLSALALGGGLLGQATQPAAAVVPGANGRIAFQSVRDGDFEIYSMGSKGELGKHGKKARKLTSNDATDGEPAWSPDGSKIAFSTGRDGQSEVYVMDADGSNQTNLTNNVAYDAEPTWSPDGKKIAFVSLRDGHPEIYVMDGGGGQTNLTQRAGDDLALRPC